MSALYNTNIPNFLFIVLLIDWYLTPTLAVFQLHSGVNKFYKLISSQLNVTKSACRYSLHSNIHQYWSSVEKGGGRRQLTIIQCASNLPFLRNYLWFFRHHCYYSGFSFCHLMDFRNSWSSGKFLMLQKKWVIHTSVFFYKELIQKVL